jgi:hypothetical protein
MFRKIVFGLVIFTALASSSISSNAQSSQGLIISPPVHEVEAEPGKTYSVDYDIENNSSQEIITTDIAIETFEEGSIPGSANVVPFKPEKDYSGWLSVPKTLDFKKNINAKTSYQLAIPEKTEPGAYFFAIVYQTKGQDNLAVGGKNTVVLRSRIATLLFVNIGGDNSKQPLIQNFSATPQWIDVFFDKLDVKYDVEVKGSSFYRPIGNMFLASSYSDSITTLSSIASDNLILPGGKRSYSNCFDSSLGWRKCSQPTGNLPLIGKSSLDLRLDFNDGNGAPQSVVAKKDIFFFPYKTLLIASVIGLVVFGGYRLLRKNPTK